MSRLSYLASPEHKAASNRAVLLAILAIRRLAAAPVALIQTAIDRVTRWRDRRSTIKVLSDLDERILRDIGLLRGDIGFVVDDLIDQSRARKAANEMRRERQPARNGAPVPMGCG